MCPMVVPARCRETSPRFVCIICSICGLASGFLARITWRITASTSASESSTRTVKRPCNRARSATPVRAVCPVPTNKILPPTFWQMASTISCTSMERSALPPINCCTSSSTIRVKGNLPSFVRAWRTALSMSSLETS